MSKSSHNKQGKDHVCPVWMGYFLLNPFRRFYQNPGRILQRFVKQDFTVMDIGCGMGYFSLPMAEMVGDSGKVICVDLQEGMLKRLLKRAHKKNLSRRIIIHKCENTSLNIGEYQNSLDFILAFAVVHEIPHKDGFFKEAFEVLKSGASMLFSEPSGHVSQEEFEQSLQIASDAGFLKTEEVFIRSARSIILIKSMKG